MIDQNIRQKVRKLLAMAGDQGASDNERGFAMRKAQELIEEFNIILGEEDDHEHSIVVKMGDYFIKGMGKPYHFVIGSAVARLYDCRHVFSMPRSSGYHKFAGMNHQIEAAEETFLWIVAQIEDLYRQALKAFDGKLDKVQRAELRASFKDAAAARVSSRISKILNDRNANRDSRALVVIDTASAKIEEMFNDLKVRHAKLPALREGFGTGAGYNAGGLVRIQKEVGGAETRPNHLIEGR